MPHACNVPVRLYLQLSVGVGLMTVVRSDVLLKPYSIIVEDPIRRPLCCDDRYGRPVGMGNMMPTMFTLLRSVLVSLPAVRF